MFLRIKKLPYRFFLRAENSPTYFNVSSYLKEQHWCSTQFPFLAHFGEKNFKFDSSAAFTLEFKDLFAELIEQTCGDKMPLTFHINDENWTSVLTQLADNFYPYGMDENNLVWILKPAQLNNGQHIKIFQRLSQIEAHFIQSNRMGGDHVLQQYLTEPHLLKGPNRGHKYSLRLFVVLTNYAGAYLYPEGYFNVALTPYEALDFTNKRSHLTNEHLKEEVLNVIQIPSDQIQFFPRFYVQIKSILASIIKGLEQGHPKAFRDDKERCLAIFGFDFMVDAKEKVWVLEANHGPCFPTTSLHPLYSSLYFTFWQSFIRSFVLPIARREIPKNILYHLFEPIR